ncbi:MAG: helix-hairpin-helix domain-containing protein [Gammaproteobacteria bacterium]|uniref:Helix-hairpin-helix domain-containing protein n=1 Tax=Candidatus Thiopontia autotrophica TaxID=2841688 RepID=A0A8J6TSI5_9GAMM|nr:helix-hairpin-helix domain-containing protein [Candidatus Thiopontia autotrophica]
MKYFIGLVMFMFSLTVFAQDKININEAGLKTLIKLEHIGKKRAQMIIDHRELSPFATISEIMNITGIGKKAFEANRDIITVE